MARSLTPEIDRVLLDTHTAATYPEAVRELRRVKSVLRAAERVELLHKRQWNGPGARAREDMARALARLQRKEPKR